MTTPASGTPDLQQQIEFLAHEVAFHKEKFPDLVDAIAHYEAILTSLRALAVAREPTQAMVDAALRGKSFVTDFGSNAQANAEKLARETYRAMEASRVGAGVASDHGDIPVLGGTYETQGGERVKMVAIHNIGTHYETLEDEQGRHRYSRRLLDMGRCTGTGHNYSDPANLKRPIKALSEEWHESKPLSIITAAGAQRE